MRQKKIDRQLRSALSKLSDHAGAEIMARCRAADGRDSDSPAAGAGRAPVLDMNRPPAPVRAETCRRRARRGVPRPIRRGACAAAAALVLAAGVRVLLNRRDLAAPVRTCVYLDVNPGLEIELGDRDEVLRIGGTNADGIRLSRAYRLSAGGPVEAVYGDLIARLADGGYLTDRCNSVLISVRNADARRAQRIQQMLIRRTEAALSDRDWRPAVLAQWLPAAESERQPGTGSPGRAALIERILRLYPNRSEADLMPLKINDLNLLLTPDAADEADLTRVGTASEAAYIGRAEAVSRIRRQADFAGLQIARPAVSFDCEDGRMVYEVSWVENRTAYEVEVDALTGQLRSQTAEPADLDESGGESDDGGESDAADDDGDRASDDAGPAGTAARDADAADAADDTDDADAADDADDADAADDADDADAADDRAGRSDGDGADDRDGAD